MVSSERYQHSIESDAEDGQKRTRNGVSGLLEEIPPWPDRCFIRMCLRSPYSFREIQKEATTFDAGLEVTILPFINYSLRVDCYWRPRKVCNRNEQALVEEIIC
jgi:hypothetical protein